MLNLDRTLPHSTRTIQIRKRACANLEHPRCVPALGGCSLSDRYGAQREREKTIKTPSSQIANIIFIISGIQPLNHRECEKSSF